MITPRPHRMSARQRRLSARLRTSAEWLPGALTIGNLLAGFASILMAAQGRYLNAVWLILFAALFDALDGRAARFLGVAGTFGEQLDALADAVSFAVAPSTLAFHMSLVQLGRPGWAICFMFTACGVLRLARFNAAPVHDVRYFIGLPIPTAAAMASSVALITDGEPLREISQVWLHAGLVMLAAGLMVSRIRFRTFKDLRFGPKPYRVLALWAAIIAGLISKLEWMLPALIVAYLVSPFLFHGRVRRSDPGTSPAHEIWRGESAGVETDETS